MTKVINYSRVSSSKQAEQGESVEFQQRRLNEHSKENEEEVFRAITDAGKSASIDEDKIDIWYSDGIITSRIDIRKRPGMVEIFDLLENKDWDKLKATKWDRLSRNDVVMILTKMLFSRHGKEIEVTDESNDSIVSRIMSIFGQEEITKMKRRVKDARTNRFENGMFVGRPPFGYDCVRKNKKVVGHKINKKQAEIVKACFEMTAQGKTYRDICEVTKLAPQQYYNIIRNKAYAGFVEFNGEIKEGIHEPLIDSNLWEKVCS